MKDLNAFISQQEDLLRAGKGSVVRANLEKCIRKGKVARQFKGAIANLARRIGLLETALKILYPIVRTEKELDLPATDYELLQYGAALVQAGAFVEANALLERVNFEQQPEKELYLGMNLFSQWRYDEAIPHLKKFLSCKGLSRYQELLGKVNLASAFVATNRFEEGVALATETSQVCETEGLMLLQAFCLEISAQANLSLRSFSQGLLDLDRADDLLRASGHMGILWVKKWRAIHLLMTEQIDLGLAKLSEVRSQALQNSDWETLRECDLFQGIYSGEDRLFLKAYFSTPFSFYKKRALEYQVNKNFVVPEQFSIEILGETIGQEPVCVDLASGSLASLNALLRPGTLTYDLFMVLTEDLYSPARIVPIFAALHKDEYYNPLTSPKRVYELVRRLNLQLQETGISFEFHKTGYRLRTKSSLQLRMGSRSSLAGSRTNVQLDLAQKHFLDRQFSTSELAETLSISERSAQRLLKYAIDQNLIAKSQAGYRFLLQAA